MRKRSRIEPFYLKYNNKITDKQQGHPSAMMDAPAISYTAPDLRICFNYFTVTVTVAFLEPDVTVIFAVPFFFAVITPLELTVAILVSELL